MRKSSRELRGRARELRREGTAAEERLWNGLRGWRFAKFRRQHPLGRFILDFYCPAARLCIEVDGGCTTRRASGSATTSAARPSRPSGSG